MSEMGRTLSVIKKREVAATVCREAGYARRRGLHRCVQALVARDAQRARDRIEQDHQEARKRDVICGKAAARKFSRCVDI